MRYREETRGITHRDKFRTVILLDAGHGGTDAGKTGTNGVEEKEINLKIAYIY